LRIGLTPVTGAPMAVTVHGELSVVSCQLSVVSCQSQGTHGEQAQPLFW
jgi:hypothetical protein